ncbi:MAG: hypothetical protein H6765_10970 [Candidatus Peribacteria bacterium]|nr:MAG: hypothetical protein H6765_10970 [Candidatus Peribacteria bacterium]
MAVDIHNVGSYDLVVLDADHDFAIDTILYDINKDGKVDLEIHQAKTGAISREVVSAQKQLRILLLIACVILLISLLWYTGWKQRRLALLIKKNQQLYMQQMMAR